MTRHKDEVAKGASTGPTEPAPRQCGIVMPIAAMDSLPADHWIEVKSIIVEAVSTIASPRFVTTLVSESDDVGVIHKRIVQNVYQADIVVCDVSGKNPNVLFELGMRLAFDKPTVIIKDDKTDYMFDTGVIEHLTYPRDLRFQRIVAFKELLADKVRATYNAAQNDPEHSTFLKSFGTFKVAQLNEKEAPAETVILEMLTEMQKELQTLRRNSVYPPPEGDGGTDDPKEYAGLVRAAEMQLKLRDPASLRHLFDIRPHLETVHHNRNVSNALRARAATVLRAIDRLSESSVDGVTQHDSGNA